MLIVLRGEIDVAAVDQLGIHLNVAVTEARFVDVNASAVDGYDPSLLSLLGRTQRRLARRHGMLGVHGLHPNLLLPALLASPSPPIPDLSRGD